RFGAGNVWKDVTAAVQKYVSNELLAVPVNNSVLGDPLPGTVKTLKVIYSTEGLSVATAEQNEGSTLQISKSGAAAQGSGGNVAGKARIDELRKGHPKGLLIVSARFGEGNRWADLTQMIQKAVTGDSLTVPISAAAFGDPAPGSTKRFEMTYVGA